MTLRFRTGAGRSAFFFLLPLAASCGGGSNGAQPASGPPLISTGPVGARQVEAGEVPIPGPYARAQAGDVVIGNALVRFVIQKPGAARAFGFTGGGVIDGDIVRPAAVEAQGDRLNELIPVARTELTANARTMTILENGPLRAVVRVEGPGVTFGYIAALGTAIGQDDSGLVLRTDYILEDGKSYLELRTEVVQTRATGLTTIGVGDIFATGGDLDVATPELPVTRGSQGPYYGLVVPGGDLGFFDIRTIAYLRRRENLDLTAPGPHVYRRCLLVAEEAGDLFEDYYGLLGRPWGIVEGRVRTAAGDGIRNAEVALRDLSGELVAFTRTRADGTYRVGSPMGNLTLALTAPGHVVPAPRGIVVADGEVTVEDVALPAGSGFAVDIRSAAGGGSPARIEVAGRRLYSVHGNETFAFEPGRHRARFTRGLEWRPVELTFDVTEGLITSLSPVILDRVAPTPGYVACDSHLHCERSLDSLVLEEDRVRACIGEGIEYAISTDHDAITDYRPALRRLGAEHLLFTSIGSEVSTLVTYGHMNAWPLEVKPEGRQGGWVDWRDLSTAGLFAAARAQTPGPEVLQLNHPRSPTSIFSSVQFNPATGRADRDPVSFGLPPGTDVLSWDFDAVEILNGNGRTLPDLRLLLADCYAFFSRGKRLCMTGVSDSHSISTVPGFGRTYIRVANDSPDTLTEAEAVDAFRGARGYVTNGPLLDVSINDPTFATGGPGALLANVTSATLHFSVRCLETIPLDWIEVVANGQVLATLDATAAPVAGGVRTFTATYAFTPTVDTWIHIVVFGDGVDRDLQRGGHSLAVSHPIYLDVASDANQDFDPPL